MIAILNFLLVTIPVISALSTEDFLKSQFPIYGLTEVAAREYANSFAKDKSPCNNHLRSVFHGIKKRERWALKILGSSGAPAGDFVWSNNYWLGAYSQCQRISSGHQSDLISRDDVQPFGVSFYVGIFKGEGSNGQESLIHLGFCLPSICLPEDLAPFLVQWSDQNFLANQNIHNFTLKFQSVRVIRSDHSWLYGALPLGLAIAIAYVILLLIIGTLYDIYVWTPATNRKSRNNEATRNNVNDNFKNSNIRESSKLLNKDNNLNECCELKFDHSQHKSMPVHITKPLVASLDEPKRNIFAKLVLCFSVTSNMRKFFDHNGINNELTIVHSLKFFGMLWLIWLYLDFYVKSYSGGDANPPYDLWKMYLEKIKINSTLSFDTFFFTGGFSLAYGHYKNHRASSNPESNISVKKKVNELSLAFLKRFFRLTPLYVVIVGLVMLTVEISKRTSLFEVQERADEICPKTWWRNIAYVNNLFKGSEMCLSWSWFMSTDMQFFLIGLILLILSIRFLKAVTIACAVIIISSSLLTGCYGSRFFSAGTNERELLDLIYTVPWARVAPYLLGILTAYFIVHSRGELLLKRPILITCWIVGTICFAWTLSGLKSDKSYISAVLHAALSRIAWSFSLSWIIIASCTGNARILKLVLSFPAWTMLDKLFYPAYLSSPLIFMSIMANAKGPVVDLDSFQTVVYFIGTTTIVYVFAFLIYLSLEIPLKNFGKNLFGQIERQNQLT